VSPVRLWAEGEEGLAHALDPHGLAAQAPGWAADVERFGPWEREALPGPAGPVHVWRAAADEAGPDVLVCGPCSSALDVVRRFICEPGLAAWSSVLAVSQWSGRGQYRRPWQSPPGNIHAALVWPGAGGYPFSLQLAPLVAGLLLAEALEEMGAHVQVKWPNDLLHRGGKVAGILVEERGGVLTAGVGMNLAAAPEREGPGPNPRATPAGRLRGALDESHAGLGPLGVWRELAGRAVRLYEREVLPLGEERLLARIQGRLAWLGREAVAVDASAGRGDSFDNPRGVIVGLNKDGALRMQRDGHEFELYSGSIALADSGRPGG
jgi:BirA family biotin operon repressor/biotin-[acetyl-CoA-carboxylase] ligase